MFAGEKPGSTRCRFHNERSISIEPTPSTTASAICTATSVPSVRRRDGVSVVRDWRSSDCRFGRAVSAAGISATATATATDTVSTLTSTVQSSAMCPTLGTSGGNARDQRRQRERGQADAGRRSEHGEHGLFREDLFDQAGTRRAERGAQRHLVDALDRSAEHERAEVDRGQHQDQSNRAEQDQQRRPHVAGDRLLQ